jgi:hypothetical protein
MTKEMIDRFKQLVPGSRRRLPFKKFDVDVFQDEELRCGVIIKGVQGQLKHKAYERFDVGTYDEVSGRALKIRSNVDSDDELRIFGYLIEFVLAELAKTPRPKSVDIRSNIQKWLTFSKSTKKSLSRSKQIGLMGELWFLEALMEEMPNVNHLDGWTGPEGFPVDFSFGESFGVEVKSRLQPFKDWLSISSTSQLDNSLPDLHLVVYDFVPTDGGINLKEKVDEVKGKFSTLDEEFAFLDSLSKVGYEHHEQYSNLVKVKYFGVFSLDVRVEDFPLLKKPMDIRIDKVKYDINILNLERLDTEVTHSIIRNRLELD